jgi:hypothetical protein
MVSASRATPTAGVPRRHRFTCATCGDEVHDGRGRYHPDELRQSGRCAPCHEARLYLEARDPRARVAPYAAARAVPCCRHCGVPLAGAAEGEDIARYFAERICFPSAAAALDA